MDEINLSNLINESILEDESEFEIFLKTFAMRDVILNGSEEDLDVSKDSIEEIEAMVAYLTKK